MLVLLLLLLPGVRTDVPTPSSELGPRNYNHHPFDAVKFVKSKPSKKGPILFPNDAPPPPPTPLIVTSRPLSESIARSELNPNNSLTAQSQLNQVSYVPEYLTRVSSYKPYAYVSSVTPLYSFNPTPSPFAETSKKFQGVRKDHFYTDYETILKNTIQKRKHAEGKGKKERWNSPKYRRRLYKKPKRAHSRRKISYDDDDSMHVKVRHRSIYSRENDYNDEEPHYRRMNHKPKRFNTRYRYKSGHQSEEFSERKESLENENRSRRNKRSRLFESSVEKHKPPLDVEDQPKEQTDPPVFLPESAKYRNTHQLRFKTQDRNGKPKKAPEYVHYERDRDTSKDYHQGENYAFSYTVKDRKTGDDFSHSQQSTGSATNGEYRVRLPDGRMQIVSYTADENGYKADVRYDGHHNDNSIDVDTSRELRYQLKRPVNKYNINDERTRYNENDAEFHSHEYPAHRYLKNDKTRDIYEDYRKERPTVIPEKEHESNLLTENHDDFSENNQFTDRSNDLAEDLKSGGLTEHNDEYLEHYIERNAETENNEKLDRAHDTDYFHYTDEIPFSKEIKDYSSEFNTGYKPYKSKYSAYSPKKRVKSTVRPSYDELKDLFITNLYRRRVPSETPVSSTFKPSYETTTEKVVIISPKKTSLYTNIRDIISVTPAPLPFSTPSSYLVSTIANLKSKVNLINKPVLSNKYIEKINKYLSYK